MLLRIMATAVLTLVACGAPAVAGNFDGRWIAQIPPQAAPCNGTSVMTLLVSGDTLIGEVHTPWGHGSFNGKIDDNGAGDFTFGRDIGTIQFEGDTFDANWTNGRCNVRHALGDREPDEMRRRQLVDERRRLQIDFDALVKSAEAGGVVDYAVLRRDYPYTEFWDAYGARTGTLLKEAAAAQKGGDCPTALTQLRTIVKYDFTIDSAHALTADCLKEAGDGVTAVIEDGIANGLVRSLMTSGDGASEATAYHVVTAREEADVLANRHIQIKTRQSDLRGSDGRYYELVQGVSVRNGKTEAASVYFDTSAFVVARQSRAAAVSVATASIH